MGPDGGDSLITTLTGSNYFMLHAQLAEHVRAFVAEYTDMGLEKFDGEEAEYDRMREAIESMPFLASKKLVLLRTPSANKQFVEQAEALLTGVLDTTDVIIVEPKLDKRSSYYKFLQKNTRYTEYTELDEGALARWLVERAKDQGAATSMADARYLIGRVGASQQLLAHEVDKLAVYDAQITRHTIDILVEPTPQSSIFDLLDAAFAGRTTRAFALYAEQRAARVEPQQILAMVAWQLHVLAVVKAAVGRDPAVIAKEAKLNPYVVRKTAAVAQKLSGTRVKQLVHDAVALDARLKSEALNADDAIQHYILQLAM